MHETDDTAPPRLTLRFLFGQVVERFFNVEHGWLRTARELFTGPGPMIRRYLETDRKSYANPLSYLLMTSAVSLLVQKASGFQERYLAQIRSGMVQSQGQLELANRLTELVFQNLLYVSFAIFIPFAILLRWFFRRGGLNLAETFVFVFFTGGQMAFLGLVLVLAFLTVPMPTALYAFLGTSLAFTYYSYAAIGLYGGRVGTVVKTCLAYLISFGSLMLTAMVATVVYVMTVQPALVSGESWNLVRTAEDNLVDVARGLLEDGADVDQTLQRTPLHVAAAKGHAEMVELLLEFEADVNARDHLGRVPMHLALAGGHDEVARRLSKAGTDPTSASRRGTTLLMTALLRKNSEMARWALAGGADVDAVRKDSRKATALMIAAASGDLEIVDLLLEHGADPSLTNEDGETALDLARGRAVADRLRAASSAGAEASIHLFAIF